MKVIRAIPLRDTDADRDAFMNAPPRRRRRKRHGACAIASPTAARSNTLTQAAIAALGEALADEQSALATYQAAIARYGPVRPFINIARAEARHIGALLNLYRRFGLQVPPAASPVNAASLPNSAREMCARAAEAEIANVALYDTRLLPSVAEYEDVRAVMTRLRDASQNNHLPAFQRCAQRP